MWLSNIILKKKKRGRNTLANLIGSRAPSNAIVVKGNRRRCLQWVSMKPMCHPKDKDKDLRRFEIITSNNLLTHGKIYLHKKKIVSEINVGGQLKLAFDASFWLTSFYQGGSLELSNDDLLYNSNVTLLHSDNASHLK